jgi:hypothetical protein
MVSAMGNNGVNLAEGTPPRLRSRFAWARQALVFVGLAVSVGGCALVSDALTRCDGDLMVSTTLFLGRGVDGRTVSDEDWARFQMDVLGKEFNEGFTVLDGQGQWSSDVRNATVQEASKVVIRLHGGDESDTDAIARVINAYKEAFAQESVLRVDEVVCAQF